jgi:hypothetical protein
MMAREQDHYAVLGLQRSASDGEVKRRYRALMRQVHPDANSRDPQATRKAARINAAFETLGNREKRRAYDAAHGNGATSARDRRTYAEWAHEPDWEDIVVEHVPPKRPPHVHAEAPLIEPETIDVDLAELQGKSRVSRTIRITNRCACVLKGDVSTSEPWVWGPVGRFAVPPGGSHEITIEIVARRVRFPGVSRVLIVANEWTGVVPVTISGFQPRRRRVIPATDSAYVRARPRRWARNR